MSLKPGEQRTLAEIESRLRSSDPELVVMFTRLARGDRRWASLTERVPLRRPEKGSRARTVILLAVGAVLLAAFIAVAVATAGHAGPQRGGHPPAGRAGTHFTTHSAAYFPGAHFSASETGG
jgi:hypothetical protein